MSDLTPEQVTDGQRDALIMLTAWATGDQEALSALQGTRAPDVVIAAGLITLITDLLAETGTDLAEWVARKQAELLAGEAEGGA